ncbi:hypothetical protein [Myceligenerans crystallogenes]|uniref:EamA-like transporter family protein n=1 Tax=Myceligenerans crystallogenes TaxID=316335 RepID=A0ABP4ZK82_9MICO
MRAAGDLVRSVLGVGMIVAPGAAAATSGWVTAATAAAIGSAALIFRFAPFGGRAVSGVGELPAPHRWIYAAGFTGGGAFMLSAAVELSRAAAVPTGALGAALAAAGILVCVGGLPGRLPDVRLAATAVVAAGLAWFPATGQVLTDGVTPVTALAAGLLMCVGWERLARQRVPVAGLVLAAGVVIAVWLVLVLVGGSRAITGFGEAGVGFPETLVGVAAAVLLVTYAATNARAVAGFAGAGSTGARATWGRVAVLVAMGAAAAAVPAEGRWWLLSLPGAAIVILYTGFLLDGVRGK